MAVDGGGEFDRAFRGAVQYSLDSGFNEIFELKPVQEEALLHFVKREDVFAVLPTGCGKSLIFQLVPKVCEYLHDQGFQYPKAAILVVVCPLSLLHSSRISFSTFCSKQLLSFSESQTALATPVFVPSTIFRTICASDSSLIFLLMDLDGYTRLTCEIKTLLTIIQ